MAAESDVLSEIEVLQSIYLDELQVKETEDRGWEVSLVLYPSTAEDSMSQFVRLTLMLTLDQQYPASSPTISIHNPRGLSDDKLRSVQKCLQLEAQSSLGSPVLYQLIEKAKEILTESNIPHGNCVICLYGFKEGEAFTKTSCYHYFHSHCLGRYACHSEKELHQREKELEEDKTREMLPPQELSVVCPVCREPLDYDLDHLLASPAPQLPELDQTVIGVDFQQKWVELQRLWEKQRSRGGIIDLEVESNRFLIHINEVPPEDTLNGPPAPAASSAPSDEAGSIKVEPSVFGPSQRRGGPGHRRHHRGSWQRRGGGSRHLQGQAAAVTERLDKLGLSSDHSHGTVTEQDRGDLRHPAQEHTEPRDPVAVREFHPDDRSTCFDPKHTADSVGSHAPPGRRRGPHRFFRQPSRSRGGVGNHHCRGARFHSGHSRGFQQKVEEMARGREGAL